jgi:HAMP domain-containing protein
MPVDIDKTKGIIDTLKGMSSKELAVTIFLIVSAVILAFWIEGRYAKIEETRAEIQKTEAYIRRTEAEIKKHKHEILQMHIKTLELIKLQPKHVQESIDRSSKLFMENFRRLESSEEQK